MILPVWEGRIASASRSGVTEMIFAERKYLASRLFQPTELRIGAQYHREARYGLNRDVRLSKTVQQILMPFFVL